VPGVVGDTGTWPGAGRTSELLGLGFGATLIVGGGSCATVPLADESSIVNVGPLRVHGPVLLVPHFQKRAAADLSRRFSRPEAKNAFLNQVPNREF
jgi:hypothetical protein